MSPRRYGWLVPALTIVGTLQATLVTVALLIEERATLRQGGSELAFFFLALPMTLIPNLLAGALVVWATWAVANKIRRPAPQEAPGEQAHPVAPAKHSRPVLATTGALVGATAILGVMTPFSMLLLFAAPLLLVGALTLMAWAFTNAGTPAPDGHGKARMRLHVLAAGGGLAAIMAGFVIQRLPGPSSALELLTLQLPLVLTGLAAGTAAWAMLRYGGGRRDHAGLAATLTVFTSVTSFAAVWFYVAWNDVNLA